MKGSRKYWRHPRLASQLSKEQRKKVAERFLALAEKSKKDNAIRMSNIMKERNGIWRVVAKEKPTKAEKNLR